MHRGQHAYAWLYVRHHRRVPRTLLQLPTSDTYLTPRLPHCTQEYNGFGDEAEMEPDDSAVAAPSGGSSGPTQACVLFDFEGRNEGELAVSAVRSVTVVIASLLVLCRGLLAPCYIRPAPLSRPTLALVHYSALTLVPANPALLRMQGDHISVMEKVGSDWVKASFGGREGYVPTSYIG